MYNTLVCETSLTGMILVGNDWFMKRFITKLTTVLLYRVKPLWQHSPFFLLLVPFYCNQCVWFSLFLSKVRYADPVLRVKSHPFSEPTFIDTVPRRCRKPTHTRTFDALTGASLSVKFLLYRFCHPNCSFYWITRIVRFYIFVPSLFYAYCPQKLTRKILKINDAK